MSASQSGVFFHDADVAQEAANSGTGSESEPGFTEPDSGPFELRRWPRIDNDPLQAWGAADEYLLKHVAEHWPVSTQATLNVLLVNDAQGALATALNGYQLQSWSDSSGSHRAAVENRTLNGISAPLPIVTSIESPTLPVDLVLVKIPKTTALLEDQLARLQSVLLPGTPIIAAGMIKHMQKSAYVCLEKFGGEVSTSLAWKKARLIFTQSAASNERAASAYPSSYYDPDVGFSLSNHANVFSRDHLDHGSRLLLTQYDLLPSAEQVVDLACGNGVLGLKYQQRHPASHVLYTDESYSAIDSARMNHAAVFDGQALSAKFRVADGLENQENQSVDLILCNPPFHQQHAVGDRVALSLFESSKRCLRQGGELWIVANRSLGYVALLKRLFGNCRTVTVNKKFVVLKVVKR